MEGPKDSTSAAAASLERKLSALEKAVADQAAQHTAELERCAAEIRDLRKHAEEIRGQVSVGRDSGLGYFTRCVQWTITDFARKARELSKGQAIFSPKFRAAGLEGLHLEFYPNGREKTSADGFCSLFFWCPGGTWIRYQLWVGSFVRSPDEDEYEAGQGHGHSNFCPLLPEVDQENDSVRVGVDILQARFVEEIRAQGLRLTSSFVEGMVGKEMEVIENRSVEKVIWKINNVSQRMKHLPRGASMWSPLFTAAGISEIHLQLYPNGSGDTTKEGHCAFYIKCPPGVATVLTLFVGKVKRGPIKATFEAVAVTGLGLPDWCVLEDEINLADDTLEVGVELQPQQSKTLAIES